MLLYGVGWQTATPTPDNVVYQALAGVPGNGFAAAGHSDNAWMRLADTADLTNITAAQHPELRLALSYDTEPGYDNVIIEAHTAGSDDWTTLPDANGHTGTTVPTDCAGTKVEVAVAYISDSGGGGRGAFVDDARVVTGGATVNAADFESGLGTWKPTGAPAGSPGNTTDWTRSGPLLHSYASVSTKHSVLLGFGLESVPSPDQRTTLITKALNHLL